MRLSKRGEYGLRALMFLTRHHSNNSAITIKEIAEGENIPVKFLEQILVTLKNAGLLNSKMGVGGGYFFAKLPASITLGQIIRILDGPLAPVRCVSQIAYQPCECPDEQLCGLHMIMGDVRNAIADILDNTTLEDINQRIQQTADQLSNANASLPSSVRTEKQP